MAQFDVHARADRSEDYLLNVQANLLDRLSTRLVVPLLPEEAGPSPAMRLNPVFQVEGRRVMMATQFATAVHVRELGARVTSLLDQRETIVAALDLLITGV